MLVDAPRLCPSVVLFEAPSSRGVWLSIVNNFYSANSKNLSCLRLDSDSDSLDKKKFSTW